MADDEIEGSRRPDDADDAPDEDSVETSDSEASGPGDEAGRPSVEVGEPTEAVPVVESSADLLARRFVDDDGDPDEDDGHIAAEPVFRRDWARIPRVLRRDAAHLQVGVGARAVLVPDHPDVRRLLGLLTSGAAPAAEHLPRPHTPAGEVLARLAGAGLLEPVVKEKIHRQAQGELLPGHRKLRPDLSRWQKFRNFSAMVRIAMTGR